MYRIGKMQQRKLIKKYFCKNEVNIFLQFFFTTKNQFYTKSLTDEKSIKSL